jgi:hypothetical protein
MSSMIVVLVILQLSVSICAKLLDSAILLSECFPPNYP